MQKRMNTIFMNSKSSKTSDPHRLLFDISEKKINLKKCDKYVALSNRSIYYTWKNTKRHIKIIKFKIPAPT